MRTRARPRLPYTSPTPIPCSVYEANCALLRQPMRRKIAPLRSTRGTMDVRNLVMSIPEVARADGVVGLQFGARPRENDLPSFEDVARLRRLEGEAGVLLDDENAQA